MAFTNQFTVTGSDTPVIVGSSCRNIRVSENRGVVGYPTTDFNIKKPKPANTPVRIQAGAQYIFQKDHPNAFYQPNDIAGYISTVSGGSTTFDQDESSAL